MRKKIKDKEEQSIPTDEQTENVLCKEIYKLYYDVTFVIFHHFSSSIKSFPFCSLGGLRREN